MTEKDYKYSKKGFSKIDEDIDLIAILNFFLRNKFLISFFSLLFFLLAIFYSFIQKKVWEGKFQIVLNLEKGSLSESINPRLENLFRISRNDNLTTQVGILESPSILMPIFDFVSLSEKKVFPNKKMYFTNWKNQLEIELEKGTSILNISYLDTNKDRIIPVLMRITKAYQEYSGSKRKRALELSKKYLNEQILLFKEKSSNSLKRVQQFAIDQDLIYEDNQEKTFKQNTLGNRFIEGGLLSNIGIENVRVQAANEIRRIDLQIAKIKKIGNNVEKLQYIGSTIPALVEEGLPLKLAQIEKKLAEKKTKYSNKDKTILLVNEERDLLIKVIKNRALGYLEAKRLKEEATMQAAMRPKGVLLKYKELIRESGRDESTLIGLENELSLLQLEEAKLEDPWELITIPTLTQGHVKPSKLKNGLLGLLSGFLLSIGFTFFKEKKSGLIFNSFDLEKLFSFNFIENIKREDLQKSSKNIQFLKEYINNGLPNKVFLFVIGDVLNGNLNELDILLGDKNILKKDVSIISNFENLNQITDKDGLILISSLGCLSYTDASILKKYLDLKQVKLSGLLLIEQDQSLAFNLNYFVKFIQKIN